MRYPVDGIRGRSGERLLLSAGDFIAYDDAELFPGLYTKFGPFVIGVVLAHEWGHAIEVRGGVSDSVAAVTLENQADCFSGAWTRWIADGNASALTINGTDLDGALGGLLFFRDQPGTTSADEQAHGSGFDRVRAFQEGFEQGASHSAGYETDPPQPLDLQFRDTHRVGRRSQRAVRRPRDVRDRGPRQLLGGRVQRVREDVHPFGRPAAPALL